MGAKLSKGIGAKDIQGAGALIVIGAMFSLVTWLRAMFGQRHDIKLLKSLDELGFQDGS